MATVSSYGTSPAVKITREQMVAGKYHKIHVVTGTSISPPVVNVSNAWSVAMSKWVQAWPTFNFAKIGYAIFDGVAQYTGLPSNSPEKIKDYHFIGVMRNIDSFLSPTYSATIFGAATTPGPSAPP